MNASLWQEDSAPRMRCFFFLPPRQREDFPHRRTFLYTTATKKKKKKTTTAGARGPAPSSLIQKSFSSSLFLCQSCPSFEEKKERGEKPQEKKENKRNVFITVVYAVRRRCTYSTYAYLQRSMEVPCVSARGAMGELPSCRRTCGRVYADETCYSSDTALAATLQLGAWDECMYSPCVSTHPCEDGILFLSEECFLA